MATGRLHTREDSGIHLDAEGRWFHDGERVEHPRIVEAWNRGIERAPDGRFILRFGWDWCYFTVEDAPLQVTGLHRDNDALSLQLSNGAVEPLDPASLTEQDGVLYCVTRSGLEARFSRAAQGVIADELEEVDGRPVLRLGSAVYPIRTRERGSVARS